MRVLLDTSVLIAFFDSKDEHHEVGRGKSRAADALISATATAMGTGLWTLDQDLAKAHKGAVLLR